MSTTIIPFNKEQAREIYAAWEGRIHRSAIVEEGKVVAVLVFDWNSAMDTRIAAALDACE